MCALRGRVPDSETLFSICAWGYTGRAHRSRRWLWPGTWDGPAPNCIYSNQVWSCFIAAGLRSVLQGWVDPEWIFSDPLLSSDLEMPSMQEKKKKAFWYLKMSLNHRLQEMWLLVFWPCPLMKLDLMLLAGLIFGPDRFSDAVCTVARIKSDGSNINII